MQDSSAAASDGGIALIGFGEAGSAFAAGWREATAPEVRAFDIKTESGDAAVRTGKLADYEAAGVAGCETLVEALAGRSAVFSVVTADQALAAAEAAAGAIAPGALYFDCNSCAPGSKRRAAAAIEAAGGRYVDVAVMAPVLPARHRTPLLISGPHAAEAKAFLDGMAMSAAISSDTVGSASATKMIRSVMIKGMEALALECVLAARREGVDEAVLASLDATFPGFGWSERAAYMLERVTSHGIRRAAEMREVTVTVADLGLYGDMSAAAVRWQQRVGELRIRSEDESYRERADAILAALLAPPEGRSRVS